MERYKVNGGRCLRLGYTTGTCAALAAGAATRLLLTGKSPAMAALTTPGGVAVEVEVLDAAAEPGEARCAVRKDAGDDPDVTDGMLVYARVRRVPGGGVVVDGGRGVGRVTKRGLEQPVGAAAINSVPRRMIAEAVRSACDELGYDGGIAVIVEIPDGERLAARTFNPRLGVEGGLSVIGTSGIVEPMSVRAVVDTIRLEMNMLRADGQTGAVAAPGNYGVDFMATQPDLAGMRCVKCANHIGETVDCAADLGFESLLFVGHIGKMIKVAGGVMDTHSRTADCRMELLALHAALAGMETGEIRELLAAVTVDDGLDRVDAQGLLPAVLESLLADIDKHLALRAGAGPAVGAVLFSNKRGRLGDTPAAAAIIREWNRERGQG